MLWLLVHPCVAAVAVAVDAVGAVGAVDVVDVVDAVDAVDAVDVVDAATVSDAAMGIDAVAIRRWAVAWTVSRTGHTSRNHRGTSHDVPFQPRHNQGHQQGHNAREHTTVHQKRRKRPGHE